MSVICFSCNGLFSCLPSVVKFHIPNLLGLVKCLIYEALLLWLLPMSAGLACICKSRASCSRDWFICFPFGGAPSRWHGSPIDWGPHTAAGRRGELGSTVARAFLLPGQHNWCSLCGAQEQMLVRLGGWREVGALCVRADTERFVATRLGCRWALTSAPPYAQLT